MTKKSVVTGIVLGVGAVIATFMALGANASLPASPKAAHHVKSVNNSDIDVPKFKKECFDANGHIQDMGPPNHVGLVCWVVK